MKEHPFALILPVARMNYSPARFIPYPRTPTIAFLVEKSRIRFVASSFAASSAILAGSLAPNPSLLKNIEESPVSAPFASNLFLGTLLHLRAPFSTVTGRGSFRTIDAVTTPTETG